MTNTPPDRPAEPAGAEPDPAVLREEIERTRKEVGDTVEALVAKTDVKARAREKAADLTTQAKQGAAEAIDAARAKASDLTGQAVSGAQTVRDAVVEATPPQAQRAVGQAAQAARPWRVPLLGAAAAAVLLAVLRRRRSKSEAGRGSKRRSRR